MLSDFNIKKYNFRVLFYALLLSIFGVIVIYSASNRDMNLVNRQILGIFISFVFMFLFSLLRYEWITELSIFIYIGCVVILVLVLLFGVTPVGAGAKRWIDIPVIGRIQPSEFVKVGLIVSFSTFLSRNEEEINSVKILFIFAILAIIPFVLIMAEPDLSTTIVMVVITLSLVYVAGISYKWILAVLGMITPIAIVFVYMLRNGLVPFLREYQARRILAWVYPEEYADIGTQQANSIMAIGSGQLFGKGLNNTTIASVKNGDFLSQEQTDFIFAVIGEELGFVGSLLVIFVIALLVFECLRVASKTKDLTGKLICVGMAALVAFQSFTNIAVATGVFPNTGLPLPFISYGVSSLLSVFVGLGIVINIGLE